MNINNKLVIILLLVLMITALTVGCKKEETVEIQQNSNAEIIKMSEELNNAMYTAESITELGNIFEEYQDRIGEQTYLTNFDVSSRLVAIDYFREYGIDDYRIKETIVSEDEGFTYVYIAYTIEGYVEPDEDSETDHIDIIIQGLNKYTYNNNKLVNFNKVL